MKGDILATGGEASRRYAAGAFMSRGYLEKTGLGDGKDPHIGFQTETAVSLLTGQATCGGSALVAAGVHAPKLESGQAAVAVANVEIDHL